MSSNIIAATYTAAQSLDALGKEHQIRTNNMANLQTTAYKRQTVNFKDLMYQKETPSSVDTGGGNLMPSAVELGNGVQLTSTQRIFSQGDLDPTDIETDLAIDGKGFFQVKMADGTLAYTRDGSFQLNHEGKWVTNTGNALDGGFAKVSSDWNQIFVSTGGGVTVTGAGGNTIFQIDIARFANPAGLDAIGNNLFVPTQASGPAETGIPGVSGFGVIRQRHKERSNVNLVGEMASMIITQRAFEINSKNIKTSDDMLGIAASLKR